MDTVAVDDMEFGLEEGTGVKEPVPQGLGEREGEAVSEVDRVPDLVIVPELHWLTEAVELTHRVGLTLPLNVAALLVATGVPLGLVLRDTVNEGEGLDVRVKGFEEITAVMVTLVHPDAVKLEEAVKEVVTEKEREPVFVKVPLGVREVDLVMVPEPHWLTEAVELTHRVGLTLPLNVAALLVATGVPLGLVLRDTVIDGEGLELRV